MLCMHSIHFLGWLPQCGHSKWMVNRCIGWSLFDIMQTLLIFQDYLVSEGLAWIDDQAPDRQFWFPGLFVDSSLTWILPEGGFLKCGKSLRTAVNLWTKQYAVCSASSIGFQNLWCNMHGKKIDEFCIIIENYEIVLIYHRLEVLILKLVCINWCRGLLFHCFN